MKENNLFKEKRVHLQQFVEEQLIGPGAYNKKYFFLNRENEFNDLDDISTSKASNNTAEILPELPAYQYSTAILFPEVVATVNEEVDNPVELKEIDELKEAVVMDENIQNHTSADDERMISKQQNYPSTFGLTFVIGKENNLESDIGIDLSFRTYSLTSSTKQAAELEYAVLIPEHQEAISKFSRTYFPEVLRIVTKKKNTFLQFTPSFITGLIDNGVNYNLINKNKSLFLKTEVIPFLQEIAVEEPLFKKDKGKDNGEEFDHYILYEYKIIQYIQKELNENIQNYDKYEEIIYKIEVFKQLMQLLEDLKAPFSRNSAELWEAKQYCFKLRLPSWDKTNRVFRTQELLTVNSEFENLKYSVQYILEAEKVFIKIVICNKNAIVQDNSSSFYLNKKKVVNEKSFFGVKLTVTENKENTLKQYNPPQIISFDEEDAFNKLIYRNFEDFGEGYNTSVKWGEISPKSKLKYVATEFLPSQDTPLVDYKPSVIRDGSVQPRLQSDEILSMRLMSSLTYESGDVYAKVTDKEILDGLRSFVNSYRNWIEDQKKELLNNSQDIDEREEELLSKQLKSCSRDYKRLSRNITLLEKNQNALIAFRLMNSAMFMQLHHSILTKGDKEEITEEFTEEAYRNVRLNNEYKWRSFQIAFILLNIDAFVRPGNEDDTVNNVFEESWPERNEVADLVWFPTGGGKTEAYLGIIAFAIIYRRLSFAGSLKEKSYGTTVIMRYTLRLLTLQQFQRATLLICALETIRKEGFYIPNKLTLGKERFTIGLFVGEGSLPNSWTGNQEEKTMVGELASIAEQLKQSPSSKLKTKIPFTRCPWCGKKLFNDATLPNIYPNPVDPRGDKSGGSYNKKGATFNVCCTNSLCSFRGRGKENRATTEDSLPFRLFDDDIYRLPPTLLFGTVDKFAALANNINTGTKNSEIQRDSRRLVGFRGSKKVRCLPPELIIQDELHLLLGPLGSAVGLYEKGIDYLCSYTNEQGERIRPKIVTSTATTRNTDKQVFALFNRRAEIFPKQGLHCYDSFFSFYKRIPENINSFESNRRYVGVLPVGKSQVWMQLRIASLCLVHRFIYLRSKFTTKQILTHEEGIDEFKKVFDYYFTVLAYYNSLKDVGKTQSQLYHYLPGDFKTISGNTLSWSFIDELFTHNRDIRHSELTGRLNGEEVKTNLDEIEKEFMLYNGEGFEESITSINQLPPEFVVATNMISVGIDISRFNTMIISSMPRNIAEYIQASSRVARDEAGLVFTVHHPFRTRDISHYQKFKEFHEKFYSYVEPISVTPFATKAMQRYLAMFVSLYIRHTDKYQLGDNKKASHITPSLIESIKEDILKEIAIILKNAKRLSDFLENREDGLKSSVEGIIADEEFKSLDKQLDKLFKIWGKAIVCENGRELWYRSYDATKNESLFTSILDGKNINKWKVSHSLRELAPTTVIKTVQQ